ncbi:hypothetical protein X777_03880 [Ooceraea biroi]|uniref:Uncharacterized protein n=1 Tax=Ooceraea biroi TaxID=2015173 RepID=A0A026WJ55_OOCBI|nr:hypothetical protein X777_03880 [Ooceraea biroi]
MISTSKLSTLTTKTVLPARCAVRILGRRYALTATGYKYLGIGINVGPPSYGLYEQRWNIQNHLRKDVRGCPINVGPLTVRISAINDSKLVCLDSSDVRLMMTDSTFFSMLNLDRCVDLVFARLDHTIEQVDAKFVRFSNIASNETNDVSNAISASDCFNENHLMDCELLALVFSKPL